LAANASQTQIAHQPAAPTLPEYALASVPLHRMGKLAVGSQQAGPLLLLRPRLQRLWISFQSQLQFLQVRRQAGQLLILLEPRTWETGRAYNLLADNVLVVPTARVHAVLDPLVSALDLAHKLKPERLDVVLFLELLQPL
jgi:hypothetical protein